MTPKTINPTILPLGGDPCELLKGDERAFLIASLVLVGERPVFIYDKFNLFAEPFISRNTKNRIELPLKPTAELPDYIPTFGFGVNHNILMAEVWPWLDKGCHRWWEHMIVGRKDFTLSAYV